jgi:hypothetical protein
MCGHACCRNKRVHPANMPVILPDKLLRRASDDDLRDHYLKVSRGDSDADIQAQHQVLFEMDRRDRREQERAEAQAAYRRRLAGQRMEYEATVEAAYQDADRQTRGNLLNRAGVRAGIDEKTLFTGSETRAHRYASKELLNYWETHDPGTRRPSARPSRAVLDSRRERAARRARRAKAERQAA